MYCDSIPWNCSFHCSWRSPLPDRFAMRRFEWRYLTVFAAMRHCLELRADADQEHSESNSFSEQCFPQCRALRQQNTPSLSSRTVLPSWGRSYEDNQEYSGKDEELENWLITTGKSRESGKFTRRESGSLIQGSKENCRRLWSPRVWWHQ
jgi:hypothetical protein